MLPKSITGAILPDPIGSGDTATPSGGLSWQVGLAYIQFGFRHRRADVMRIPRRGDQRESQLRARALRVRRQQTLSISVDQRGLDESLPLTRVKRLNRRSGLHDRQKLLTQ